MATPKERNLAPTPGYRSDVSQILKFLSLRNWKRTTPRNKEVRNALVFDMSSSFQRKRTLFKKDKDLLHEEPAVVLPLQQPNNTQMTKFVWGATGIYVAYLYYGHVQEDLFRYQSINQQKFKAVWMLQAMESLANVVVGYAGRYHNGSKKTSLRQVTPYFGSGISQVFAKAFTSMALAAGLSFPVCILAKSAKLVPVMLGQLLLGGATYEWKDYIFAVLIVAGAALLSGARRNGNGGSTSYVGLVCILVSLGMDGLTAGLQKRLKRTHVQVPPTTFDFMYFTSIAMLVVSLVVALITNDLVTGWQFLQHNPSVWGLILQVCVCSAIGQSFVFYVISEFDPLVCSTVTTTRKVLTVLWSVAAKQDEALSFQGSAGLALACAGLLIEVHGKMARAKAHHIRHDRQRLYELPVVEEEMMEELIMKSRTRES